MHINNVLYAAFLHCSFKLSSRMRKGKKAAPGFSNYSPVGYETDMTVVTVLYLPMLEEWKSEMRFRS